MLTQTTESTYQSHIATLTSHYERILDDAGADAAVIPAGLARFAFQDDRDYVFAANPNFKHWLPLTQNPGSAIYYRPGEKPILLYFQEADFWHVTPSDPSGYWVDGFDIHVCRSADEVRAALKAAGGRQLVIGEERDQQHLGVGEVASAEVFAALHEVRTVKTDYELDCMRAAQRLACRGHRAAASAFAAGSAEYDIHMAYLAAMRQRELELPYNSIVALNEHAAVLHYQYLDRDAPAESRSFLIDAGAQHVGYAADITRTYGNGDTDFAALLAAMETLQLAVCAEVKAGVDYRELHLSCHHKLAAVLLDCGIASATADVDTLIDKRITWAMFPHGLGHFLGLQVHDVGGLTKASSKELIEKPKGHDALRLTRMLGGNEVLTIEPGCYFVPMLLEPLRADAATRELINWQLVDKLTPFGGIRIEDNVRVLPDGAENLTRDAFSALET